VHGAREALFTNTRCRYTHTLCDGARRRRAIARAGAAKESPMPVSRLTALAAALAALAFAAGPTAAAEAPFASSTHAPVDTVGPAAPGDPKPFRSFVQAECNGVSCVADFGKKGNKVRTVDWLTCGINTSGGILVLASIQFTDQDVPVAFMSAVSRAAAVAGEVAVAAFTETVTVPAGEFLRVEMITDGTALGSQCTASGTIE
jgi:hypothetical protein